MREPHRAPRASNAATLIALMALMLAALGLLGLVAIVMPQALGFVAVVSAVFLFVSFHYVVWGWWLQRLHREEKEWPE